MIWMSQYQTSPPKKQYELLNIDGDPDVEETCMLERGVYFSVFYCLCYVKEISTDMLEKMVSEEIYPDLNEEEDIRMEDSREEHWRYFTEDGEDKNKINALRWDVYTRDKEEVRKRELLVSIPHPKGGNSVGTSVKYNII